MLEIKITGSTPLEALSTLTAFGLYCLKDSDVYAAANRILEAETQKEPSAVPAQAVPAEARKEAAQSAQESAPASATPAPAPTEAPGPVDGENGPASAPGKQPAPTAEQVRAKGIEASRKYGKEAVVAILRKYGVTSMSSLKETDRAPFLADLEGLCEGNA